MDLVKADNAPAIRNILSLMLVARPLEFLSLNLTRYQMVSLYVCDLSISNYIIYAIAELLYKESVIGVKAFLDYMFL